MRQLVLVALLSAVASSALTVLLLSGFRPAPAAPAAASISARDFKAALGDLEREVAALRAQVSERGVSGAQATNVPYPAPRAPTGTVASPEPTAPVVRPGRPTSSLVAASLLQKFQEVAPRLPEGGKDYEGRAEVLRRWMFRPESEVHEWFGLPARIDASGDQERWFYEVLTGEIDSDDRPVKKGYWVLLSKGRVVDLGD